MKTFLIVFVLGWATVAARGGSLGGEQTEALFNYTGTTLTLPKFHGTLAQLTNVYVELELRLDNTRVAMDNDALAAQDGTARLINTVFTLTSSTGTLTKDDTSKFDAANLSFVTNKVFALGATSGDPVGVFNAQPGKADYAIWEPGRVTSGDAGNIHSNKWSGFVGSGTFTISVQAGFVITATFEGSEGFFEGNSPSGQIYARVRYDFDSSDLGDFVWEDQNGNGIQDVGEPALTNVTVQLYNASSNLLETTTTDAAGNYVFSNLVEATYFVQFTPPDGYAVTVSDAGANNELDSNANAAGWTGPIALAAGTLDSSIDAGLYRPARLYGYAYWDKDLSLTRDPGDNSASGMVVQAWLNDVQIAATNAAAADGFYEFVGLAPGTYEVRFTCNTNALTAVPTTGDAATNPQRNRTVATDEETGVASYSIYSGHGVGDDVGEPVNAGFTGGGPMSSGIDLRAYQGADGVYVEFVAYDVEEDGSITLKLLGSDGTVAWSETVEVQAGPLQARRFLVPGLTLGGRYNFGVLDEIGQFREAYGVTVKPFAAEMVRMSLAGITLSFDSLPEREYEIQWTARLGTAWRTVTNVPSSGERTTVLVLHPDPASPSGFFRIRLQ